MTCPFCSSEQTGCLDSRQCKNYRRRRYECYNCLRRFTTKEVVVGQEQPLKVMIKWSPHGGWKVKTSG